MSCKCQKCGNQYKVDFMLPDGIWEEISKGRNLLCGVCIAEYLELKGYGAFSLTDLVNEPFDPRTESKREGVEL